MNKFTSNQHCHSLMEQISRQRRGFSSSVGEKNGLNVDSPKPVSIIVSFPFSFRNVISGDDEVVMVVLFGGGRMV